MGRTTKISSFGITIKDKEDFFDSLATMLKSGIGLVESLDLIAEQNVGNFKILIFALLTSCSSGRALSQAMSQYPKVFSDFMINTVSAGEVSGNLDTSLENIAHKIEKERALFATIRQAMFYPIIVLTLSFFMGLLLSFWVLPKITPIFIGLNIDLPLSTRVLIFVSDFLQDHTVLVLVLIFSSIFFVSWLVRQKWVKPVTHFLLLHIPVVASVTKYKNITQASRTLAVMLKSGVGIDEALRITQASLSNYYYRIKLYNIYGRVKKGASLSEAFGEHEKYFPKIMVSLIGIGEKTGKLEEKFFHLALMYEKKVDASSKTISAAAEPVLLIFIGIVVGWLAISIITPIYSVTGNIYQ